MRSRFPGNSLVRLRILAIWVGPKFDGLLVGLDGRLGRGGRAPGRRRRRSTSVATASGRNRDRDRQATWGQVGNREVRIRRGTLGLGSRMRFGRLRSRTRRPGGRRGRGVTRCGPVGRFCRTASPCQKPARCYEESTALHTPSLTTGKEVVSITQGRLCPFLNMCWGLGQNGSPALC